LLYALIPTISKLKCKAPELLAAHLGPFKTQFKAPDFANKYLLIRSGDVIFGAGLGVSTVTVDNGEVSV
jgi:hypothetical protein